MAQVFQLWLWIRYRLVTYTVTNTNRPEGRLIKGFYANLGYLVRQHWSVMGHLLDKSFLEQTFDLWRSVKFVVGSTCPITLFFHFQRCFCFWLHFQPLRCIQIELGHLKQNTWVADKNQGPSALFVTLTAVAITKQCLPSLLLSWTTCSCVPLIVRGTNEWYSVIVGWNSKVKGASLSDRSAIGGSLVISAMLQILSFILLVALTSHRWHYWQPQLQCLSVNTWRERLKSTEKLSDETTTTEFSDTLCWKLEELGTERMDWMGALPQQFTMPSNWWRERRAMWQFQNTRSHQHCMHSSHRLQIDAAHFKPGELQPDRAAWVDDLVCKAKTTTMIYLHLNRAKWHQNVSNAGKDHLSTGYNPDALVSGSLGFDLDCIFPKILKNGICLHLA